MNWDDFDAFCHVVREGGFTAAARTLQWPKSRVSTAVARLEAALDSRLLERTTRRIGLTAQGEELYRKAAPVFERLRTLRDESAASARTVAGRLRIAAPYEFASHHLGPVASDLLGRYPALEIDIDMHYDRVDLVAERYDIVFTALDSVLPDSGLVARRIFCLQRGIFAAPGLVARYGEPKTPADLALLPMIASRDDAEWLFHDAHGTSITVSVAPRMRSPNASLRLQAAIAGLGVARITATFCDATVAAGRLVRLLPGFDCDPLRMYALLPGRQRLPARVRVFLQALAPR
jgi:DNA-binding transcriptional LysR family regulator